MAEWAEQAWSVIEPGDFVKVAGEIYRVEERGDPGKDGRVSLVLYSPSRGRFEGTRRADGLAIVRTKHGGKLTAAGEREDGLAAEGRRALQDILDAELLCHAPRDGRLVKVWRFPESVRMPELASHLSMFHEVYTNGAKTADGPELRRIHNEAHAAHMTSQPYTARRVPHVHNDELFREGL